MADLPLDHLPEYVDLAGPLRGVDFVVDHLGYIRVIAHVDDVSADKPGVLPDGSALVPELEFGSVDGVRAALAELVADYGTTVMRVGWFNGFVHMDANVEDIGSGLRIVRYPEQAAEASSGSTELYPVDALFDPTDMDPTIVLEMQDQIMEKAGLAGKVWDWEFSRPPQGGEPMFSYGVGESGPSQKIWLNADGSIAEIVDGDCAPGAGFCPG